LRSGSIRRPSAAVAGLLFAALAVAVALAAPAGADARRVRVFAMQPKLDIAWMESRRTYHDKLLALADRRLRGAGKPLIQRRADDVASHLLGPSDPAHEVSTARDLVVWPEDVGLFAALTGQRAAPARNSGSLEGAIVTLIGLYPQPNAYYGSKYPEVTSRVPQVRQLALALTDTFGHVAVETFAEIAKRHRVWLAAGVNMAQEWKIVCDDKEAFNDARPPRLPTGELCVDQDPARVDQLGDPFDPTRDYVYEADTPQPSNMALVFDPRGRLVSKQVKEYLTPTELPGQLDLVPGRVDRGLTALRTPVGTLGFVTSKDSWMPDVQARLDEAHVDLLVQPEFFVGDTATDEKRMWAPDTMLGSGYGDALRLPSVETMAQPDLVGNIFNFTSDQQSHFAVKPHGRRAPASNRARHMIGQPNRAGLANVRPWVVKDPLTPGEPFPKRRARLAAAGVKLLPGSGVECPDPAKPAPCENGHVEGVLWRDVTVHRKPRRHRYRGGRAKVAPFGRSRAVHPSTRVQRNAAIAMRGRRGVVAFEERGDGRDQLLLARTRDGGRTWSRTVRPSGRVRGRANEQWPAVAIGARGRVTVAWNDDSTGVQRVYMARSTDGGASFDAPRALDPSAPVTASQWRAALAQGPGDRVHAVFLDARARSADDNLPQAHAYYARVNGGVPEKARRLDTGDPTALAAKLDNSWAPRVTVRGKRVLVAWLDFLNYDWGVFSRASNDGGATFGAQSRVTDNREGEEQQEELADTPDPLFTKNGPLVVWTDWRKRDPGSVPHQQYDIYAARPGAGNRHVDPHGARPVSAFSPSACPTAARPLVAFQDESRAQSRIRLRRLATTGAGSGRTLRVDDGGARAGDAWRPRIACSGGRAVVAFESERDGPAQVYVASAPLRRLR
jgi:predicted amidohydrolase